MIAKKVALKGSQFFETDRIRRAMNPNGGPGTIGRIQPTKPARAKMSPKIMREVVNMGSIILGTCVKYSGSSPNRLGDWVQRSRIQGITK
jgi:hypothetical protein